MLTHHQGIQGLGSNETECVCIAIKQANISYPSYIRITTMMMYYKCQQKQLLAPTPHRRPRQTTCGRVVHCSTYWSLRGSVSPVSDTIDLTGCIGRKRVCSIGAKDYAATDAIDYTIVDHGGIHVIFESESVHGHDLDSPSVLYMTDVDSVADVCVDGSRVQKGQRTTCKPGSRLTLGDLSFTVERNVQAHA